ncbi:MAG: phage terminase small subunit P27 family [Firmicutes bacterium]|nr:phage terminase small subunit P27 family [Bacillota bacterium]
MARLAKPASGIDKKKQKKSNENIEKRQQAEQALAGSTRNLVCPDHLTDFAKAEWKRIKLEDDLRDPPVIYDIDSSALQMLCEAWSVWCVAQREWANDQRILGADADGNPIENPYLKVLRTQQDKLRQYYAMFGLTPQGRSQIGVNMANASVKRKDGLEQYLFGG